jgi:hypothetical protein
MKHESNNKSRRELGVGGGSHNNNKQKNSNQLIPSFFFDAENILMT